MVNPISQGSVPTVDVSKRQQAVKQQQDADYNKQLDKKQAAQAQQQKTDATKQVDILA